MSRPPLSPRPAPVSDVDDDDDDSRTPEKSNRKKEEEEEENVISIRDEYDTNVAISVDCSSILGFFPGATAGGGGSDFPTIHVLSLPPVSSKRKKDEKGPCLVLVSASSKKKSVAELFVREASSPEDGGGGGGDTSEEISTCTTSVCGPVVVHEFESDDDAEATAVEDDGYGQYEDDIDPNNNNNKDAPTSESIVCSALLRCPDVDSTTSSLIIGTDQSRILVSELRVYYDKHRQAYKLVVVGGGLSDEDGGGMIPHEPAPLFDEEVAKANKSMWQKRLAQEQQMMKEIEEREALHEVKEEEKDGEEGDVAADEEGEEQEGTTSVKTPPSTPRRKSSGDSSLKHPPSRPSHHNPRRKSIGTPVNVIAIFPSSNKKNRQNQLQSNAHFIINGHAFSPRGGVTSITPYSTNKPHKKTPTKQSQNNETDLIVWVAYGDGNAIRFPSSAFFPSSLADPDSSSSATSILQRNSSSQTHFTIYTKCKVHLSSSSSDSDSPSQTTDVPSVKFVPIPVRHASLLVPPPPPAVSSSDDEDDDCRHSGGAAKRRTSSFSIAASADEKRKSVASVTSSVVAVDGDGRGEGEEGSYKEEEEGFPLDDDDEEDSFFSFASEPEDEYFESISYDYKDPDSDQYSGYGYDRHASAGAGNGVCDAMVGFHTSENQLAVNDSWERRRKRILEKRLDKDGLGIGRTRSETSLGHVKDAIVGGTKALVGGVFGAAVGAVSWGLGSGSVEAKVEMDLHALRGSDLTDPTISSTATTNPMPPTANSTFPFLHDIIPTGIPLTLAVYDSPRRITSVSVDPESTVAACADTLGRVQLIDLSSKQIVRMWKGVRDATCCWIQRPRPGVEGAKLTYLVIHSKRRSTVEVYRMKHGPRVVGISVGRDARVVQSTCSEGGLRLASCFILQTITSPSKSIFILESLPIEDANVNDAALSIRRTNSSPSPTSSSTHPSSSPLTHHATNRTIHTKKHVSAAATNAMHLQILKQLLSPESHVPSSQQAVYDAFTRIGAVSDLTDALDLLAASPHLEEGLGVEGATFQSMALGYCKQKLEGVSNSEEGGAGGGGGASAVVFGNLLKVSSKMQFHSQIIEAYNVLYKFEVGTYSDDEEEDPEQDAETPRSSWAVEAMAWIETAEAVTGRGIDADLKKLGGQPLKFWKFAKACTRNDKELEEEAAKGGDGTVGDKKQKIFLSDSTKDRTAVLVHLFRPLLHDIFVFNTVNSIFSSLGIKSEHAQLQRYFGEWFMTVPAHSIAKASLFGLWCPTVRWLQDIIHNSLDEREKIEMEDDAVISVDAMSKPTQTRRRRFPVVMEPLHEFCGEAGDLPRAFLLASVCREAVLAATKQKEAKTYGKVSSADAVQPWDELLRRLRVCLLVTLRIHGTNFGPFPVSARNVNSGKIFSVYEWLARDELSISHDHDEIVDLEVSCRTSFGAFDPSSLEADSPSRWQMLQKSCRAGGNSSVKSGERAAKFLNAGSYGTGPGPLLLYLSGHNHSVLLAAHRALILAGKWGQKPSSLHILKDCVAALRSLEADRNKYKSIAAAVRLEVWQTTIRPIYRALMFGFHDVHELSEEIVSPLCVKAAWVQGLNKIASDILDLISRTPSVDPNDRAVVIVDDDEDISDFDDSDSEAGAGHQWPPVSEDVVLKGLLRKSSRPVTPVAINVHRAMVRAANVTDDPSLVTLMAPSFYGVFLLGSLLDGEASLPSPCTENQVEFMNRVVEQKALSAGGPSVSPSHVDEMEELARTWGIDPNTIRSKFLLAMYELGKDAIVEELANASSSSQLDVSAFVEGGLEIACVRLYSAISTLRRFKEYRGVVSMLDADTCQWVKEQTQVVAERKGSTEKDLRDDSEELPPLASTHALVLRLLRLSTGMGEAIAAGKAHALSVLSGTLLKAIQESSESY